ncbi:MAG: cytochrome c5 family protein [Alteromonadaceae bacterium]|uniref:Cytochrome c-555 n=2 Tax=Paraglaciecola mesophila TaxID=197222 RepID=K6Z8N5_9ALTE|nr:cytochrome c, class I [Paraglaciecola sp. T6c]MAD16238.1 cytochrome c5 family protein [Alteromonadaceae bacterium]GAC25328.1 cytochrome c-555 [Paraglaciecola mesophila KMM 241]
MEKIVKRKFLLCMFLGLASIFTANAAVNSDDEIKSRIAPVGKVHVAGAKAETASAGGPRSGADVYGAACVACHSSGVLGAPKFQNAADWAPRLEKGFDTVWQNAINGINAMPPRGTCADCSDDEIKAAIEHMTEGL